MRSDKAGFTLVEVLTVLAIVAIIAALVFPVMVGAKARAQDSHCISNLSQLGRTIALYAADHDDYPPPGGAGEGGPVDVRQPLLTYGAKVELWKCPRDRWHVEVVKGKLVFSASPNHGKFGSSYIYDGLSQKLGMSLSSGQKPAETLLMSDVFPYHSEISDPDGIFNVLFRDLHTKATRWSIRDAIRWPDFQ